MSIYYIIVLVIAITNFTLNIEAGAWNLKKGQYFTYNNLEYRWFNLKSGELNFQEKIKILINNIEYGVNQNNTIGLKFLHEQAHYAYKPYYYGQRKKNELSIYCRRNIFNNNLVISIQPSLSNKNKELRLMFASSYFLNKHINFFDLGLFYRHKNLKEAGFDITTGRDIDQNYSIMTQIFFTHIFRKNYLFTVVPSILNENIDRKISNPFAYKNLIEYKVLAVRYFNQRNTAASICYTNFNGDKNKIGQSLSFAFWIYF